MNESRGKERNVPILDLTAQHRHIEPEMSEVIEDVVERNAFIMGEELEEFESAFASFCGVDHCVGVSSGTDALKLALRAAGVGAGDEVITVPVTFIATVEAIREVGAEPVFVDVDPSTYTMDSERVTDAISDRTAALLPVHLYGQPANMDALRNIAQRQGLTIVEDACQAHGARWDGTRAGALGDLGCFSFYPGKNIGALGDAGCVTTSDETLADRLRALRNHGQREGDEKYRHVELGYNARMDNLHAAVLSLKLEHLDRWNETRRKHARRYDRELKEEPALKHPLTVQEAEHVYHQYALRLRNRDRALEHMNERGIQCGVHYPRPLHLQEACGFLGYEEGDFPVAERVCSEVLTIPCFPELTDEQQRHVLECLREFVARQDEPRLSFLGDVDGL